MTTAPIDVVIPAHPKDFAVLRHGLRALLRHVRPIRRVIIVAPQRFEARDARVQWIADPPSDVLPGPRALGSRWTAGSPAAARRGWLYQQLLKLGAGTYIADLTDTFLVLDADVVFLRPVTFDLPPGKRMRYSLSAEHVPAYADAYERLVGRRPPTDRSLTAHHMVADRVLLAEMTAELQRRAGVPWYDAFVDAVDPSMPSSICEQSTYGWWVLERHPELAEHRQLEWHDVRGAPNLVERARLAPDFDFVAAHAWKHEPRLRRASGGALRLAAELWALRHARPMRTH
jgi:hypothetical protein